MKRFTLIIFLLISFLAVDVSSQETRKVKPAETEQGNVILSVDGNVVHIQNVNTKTFFEVYNILGVKVTSIVVDSGDKTITLNLPKGCYILKIQDIVRKIAIN